MNKLVLLILLLLALIERSGAYKILVWSPTISKSHMIQNGRLADALAKDGHNVVSFGESYSYLKYWDEFYEKLKREHDDIPHPIDLTKTTDLVFINTDDLLDFPRPLPPNVIHVGGFGMDNVDTSLPKEYEALMLKGKKGVVYLSFGSIVPTNSLPQTYRKNIIDSFGNLKDYFLIMKISKDDKFSSEYAKDFENVFISSWAPQTAILAHPRTKLFITHGGYNSIMEASRFSVPLLLIGMFSDQPRNSKLIERNGWGLSLEKRSLLYGTKEFEEKLVELLTNQTYKQNAIRATNLIKTKPQTGEQRLLSYVRFLESNGGHLPELKTIASDLSLIEYLNLDVFVSMLLFMFVVAAIVVYVIRKALRICVNVVRKAKVE